MTKEKFKPKFLITIDTEGDNLWSKPSQITTNNSEYLPRFQSLCESFGFKPTYLTTYEMAVCASFKEFGQDVIKRNRGEIGMHLHAWNSPPIYPLTENDFRYQPYLVEYDKTLMRRKINVLTDLLEETFGVKMKSHRAGRWSFNKVYAALLVERDYIVDCSVTPHVSWKKHVGDPKQQGGTDFSEFPDEPYFLDLNDISRKGSSPLLEIPMTIISSGPIIKRIHTLIDGYDFGSRLMYKFAPAVYWFRPKKGNLKALLSIVRRASSQNWPYIEFMLHSSELMPGGSFKFPNKKAVENLYNDLQILFGEIKKNFTGATLSEFHKIFRKSK